MIWLKLVWVPRTTPGQTENHAVNRRIKWELDAMVERAEELLSREPLYALMDEAERDDNIPTKYSGSSYISYKVDNGDEVKDILAWWRKRGYRSVSFKDDVNVGSRDYKMEQREPVEDAAPLKFNLWAYFSGEQCKFEDVLGDDGQKVVETVIDSVPAKPAEIVYKKQLVCGDSPMPEAEPVEA